MWQLFSTVIKKRIWGLNGEKKSLKPLALRKVRRQKYSLGALDSRQVILLIHKTQGAAQLPPTAPVHKKEKRCLCNWSYSFFLLSWKNQSRSLSSQLSPAPFVLWACKPWTANLFPLGLQPHQYQGYHRAGAIAGSKKECPGLRRRVNIIWHHLLLGELPSNRGSQPAIHTGSPELQASLWKHDAL